MGGALVFISAPVYWLGLVFLYLFANDIGVVKVFPGVRANDRISFDLSPGEIHALVGENGAGKTTLMKILYGLHRPDSGCIEIRDQAIAILDQQHREATL